MAAHIILDLHHRTSAGCRRVEPQKTTLLLLRHGLSHLGLPHRLDVVEPNLPGDGLRHRAVDDVGLPAGRHREVVAQVVLPLLDYHQTMTVI